MQASLTGTIKRRLPPSALLACRLLQQRDLGDTVSALKFLATPLSPAPLPDRRRLLQRIYEASAAIDCAHTQDEMLQFITAILTVSPGISGCVVEAGCYKGGSTAKFSLAAKLANRQLFVFDSFQGLPQNKEPHKDSIFGEHTDFSAGQYRGTLQEVKRNVANYGAAEVCTYVEGWFDDTMPRFSEPVVAAYLDVDLVSSTRTCIKQLYPRLQPGCYLYSQDGHLPLIIELLRDATFWEKEVGCSPPHVEGLGRTKLVRIRKPCW